MNSITKTARIAGLLYLAVVLTGPFVLIYVPGKLFVTGDAAATAGNIAAHQSLFRAYIVVGFISELFFVAVALSLYCLLKRVNLPLAASMAILVLIDAPLAFLSVANQIATLAFVRGGQFLAAFESRNATPWRCCCTTSTGRALSSPRCSGDSGFFRSGCSCIVQAFFHVSWAPGCSSTAWPTW